MAETVKHAIARRQREREALEAEDERARRALAPAPQRGGSLTGALKAGFLQADTAARTAANFLTFGGADSLAAGLDALAAGGGRDISDHYRANLAAEQARDTYDTQHRPLAQQAGMGAAAALALFGEPGPAAAKLFGAVPTTAKRLTTAALSGRETAAILGGGAASGLALQNLSDLAAHRPSDWRDNVGAMAGGLAGAGALRLGDAAKAAAIGAATTTAVQSALRGRGLPLDDLTRSAVAGRAVGALAAKTGAELSQSLAKQAKGRLGEALGTVRSAINRMEREPGPKELVKPVPGGPGTIADGRHGEFLFEDKFGLKAALSKGQRFAQSALGPNYIVYHWLPADIGKILSTTLTGLGAQLPNNRPNSR